MNTKESKNELSTLQVPRTLNYLVSTDIEGKISKWDLVGNPEVLLETRGKIHASALSDEGRFLYVSLEKDFIIQKINLDERRIVMDFNKVHRDNIFSLKLFHNGVKLISGSADLRIMIWSVSNGQVLGEFFGGVQSPVQDMLITKDMRTLYSAQRDGSIIKWDVEALK